MIKVKKTLGMGEAEIEKARTENVESEVSRLQKKRTLATPYNKKSSSKALATLGFDILSHYSHYSHYYHLSSIIINYH